MRYVLCIKINIKYNINNIVSLWQAQSLRDCRREACNDDWCIILLSPSIESRYNDYTYYCVIKILLCVLIDNNNSMTLLTS